MLSLENAIAKFAAHCRSNGIKKFTAADWKSVSGRTETLKSVIAAIETEVSRQAQISQARASAKPLPAITKRSDRLRNIRKWRDGPSDSLMWLEDDQPGSYRLGKYLVRVSREYHEDWNAYSKSWHRNYGPKRTVRNRLTVEWEHRFSIKKDSRRLERFSGLMRKAIEAVAEVAGIPPHRGKLGLRISPYVELVPVASGHKFTQAFERRFLGASLGYVAVRRKAHYHADTLADAVAGVGEKLARERLRARQRAVGQKIGFPLDLPIGAGLRSLGFCREGTADALSMLGLKDKRYSAPELIESGEWGQIPAVARKYPRECATVAALMAGAGSLIPEQLRRLIAK